MRRLRVGDGVELALHDLGAGPPVVLVAGFGLDHRIWDGQVAGLAAAGHRVICVDPRGHGLSDKPLDGYDVDRLAADLLDVVDALGVTDVTLVGHSFAGQVAFSAVARRPDRIARLVLVGSNGVRASRNAQFPFGAPADDILPALLAGEEHDRLASRRVNIARGFATPPSDMLLGWLLDMSMQMPPWAALACYRSMLESDLLAAVDRVQLPVLQIVGVADRVHSVRGAVWLCARLADSRLVRIEDCGHYPMLEAPERLLAELLEFLDPAAGARSHACQSLVIDSSETVRCKMLEDLAGVSLPAARRPSNVGPEWGTSRAEPR